MPASREVEDRIQEAIRHLQLNPVVKKKAAAAQFNVPYERLRMRINGRPASHTRGGHNKKLTMPEDKALVEYLMLLHGIGKSANLETLILSANRLLWYNGEETNVSRRWAKRWMARHKDFFKTLYAKPFSVKRRDAHIKEDVDEHFKDFVRCRNHWGIQDEDVYNFDESGFQIGVACGDKVIVPKDCEAAYISDPENRELVTVVATINWGGRKIPPMIIFKGAYHLRKHFDNTMDPDTYWRAQRQRSQMTDLGLSILNISTSLHKSMHVGSTDFLSLTVMARI